jgi:uncharacterized protein (TIRG00374 family)
VTRSLRIAASLFVSAFFLWLAARGVSWPEVGASLREARWAYLILMTLPAAAAVYLRAIRWGILVRAVAPVGLQPLVSATAIGFAANMVLPLRAGEVLRPWLLARRQPIELASALATVALERLFDMATLLLFFGFATLMLPLPPEWRGYGWLFAGSFAVLALLLIALQKAPGPVFALFTTALAPFPARIVTPMRGALQQFADGLAGLGSLAAVAATLALSLTVWVVIALSFGFGLSAFALDVPWIPAALATSTFVAIAVAIPGGPGFVGTFQAGCVMALAIYDVPKSLAFSYSVLTHVAQFVGTVGLGLYFFIREDFSIREVSLAEQTLLGAEKTHAGPPG